MAYELISLGILFICAIVGGIIAAKFKQPAVFGMLLVGAIVGPYSLKLVEDIEMVSKIAELGAILMLFTIGLEFDVSKLMKVGVRSVVVGLLKFAIVLFFGYQATLLLGYSPAVALFIGVILSFSSTIVVVKVLEQKEMFSRKEVPLLIAVLIIEDILAVFALTFFSGITDSNAGLISTFEHIIFSIAILIFAYLVAMKTIKYVVRVVMKNSSDESVLISLSFGLGALFSYFASYLGLTPSAGAFLAGSVIASLPNSKEYGKAIHSWAMIFTSIFFIAIGTTIDFSVVEEYLPLIGVLLLAVLFSRFIAVGFVTMLIANFRDEQPFFSSIAMISVGEFSLLIAKESQKFGLGIDLVTITAAIIFMTAIFMTIGLNYSESIHSILNSKIPIRAKLKLERLSNYMRKFFDQMEIENFFTNKLKADSKIAFMLIVLTLFASLTLRRISSIIGYSYGKITLYIIYVISSIIVLYLLHLIYKRLKEMHHTTSVILTHVDSSKNLKRCSSILNNLLLTLCLFFFAMLFPFVIFLMGLNTWANIVPFILIFASYYFAKKLVALMDFTSGYSPTSHSGLPIARV